VGRRCFALGRPFVGPAERLRPQADVEFGFVGFDETGFTDGNLGAGGAAKGGDGGSILGLPEPVTPFVGRNLAMELRPEWAAAEDQE